MTHSIARSEFQYQGDSAGLRRIFRLLKGKKAKLCNRSLLWHFGVGTKPGSIKTIITRSTKYKCFDCVIINDSKGSRKVGISHSGSWSASVVLIPFRKDSVCLLPVCWVKLG